MSRRWRSVVAGSLALAGLLLWLALDIYDRVKRPAVCTDGITRTLLLPSGAGGQVEVRVAVPLDGLPAEGPGTAHVATAHGGEGQQCQEDGTTDDEKDEDG